MFYDNRIAYIVCTCITMTFFSNCMKKENNLESNIKMLKSEMIEKQTIQPQEIIDCLSANYGITVTALIRLPLGADMNASVYKAETRNGPSYFLKLKQGHHDDISVTVLALLQALGIQQIIPPIKTIHGKLIQYTDDFTLIVYPFIRGQNGFCLNLTDDQWITLGRALKQVHELEVPSSIKNRIRKETYSSKWREAVRSLDAHLDETLTGDAITLKLQAFMKEHRPEIHRLVDQAEFLSQKIQVLSPELVLCHSDIHGGNVLIDENGAIYVVDWDEPIMAPKERDLMFIGGGVANIWNNPHEEEFFYKGYGKTEINMEILAYYRHERIVEDIALLGQALLLTTEGGENRLEMYKQLIDMFKLRGVVDIAFKTDNEFESIKMKDQKKNIKTAGQFSAHDKLGTPVIIEWQKTTLFAPEFAILMKAAWSIARNAYTEDEMQFLRSYPEVVNTEDESTGEFYKPFKSLFKNGLDRVDWNKVKEVMQEALKPHFIFDASTWGPEVTAMFAKDICYGITVKDTQTQKLLGFITFMIRPSYAPGDVKMMITGIDKAYLNRDLDRLLMSLIIKINPDIKRICTCVRVTNNTTLKNYNSWGFANTDNPILDHPHNFKHWIFLEYKTSTSNLLQKAADGLVEIK